MTLLKPIARTCILVMLTLGLPGISAAQLPTQEYTLDNGLKLIVRENHRAPIAIFQIWYRVGSSHEPLGITGVSHVLEHMMFKGTDDLEAGEFSRIVSEHGGQENAFTSRDYTGYFQVMPSAKIELSFKLESDRMRNLEFTQEDFDKELQVVLEERRSRIDDNPQALAFERFNAAAFISNSYHQPIIGWPHDLRQLTIEDVKDWYDKWYTPNNAVIVVVGDVNPQQMRRLAKKYFGGYPSRPLPTIKAQKEMAPLGLRQVEVKANARLPYLYMGYNTPVLQPNQETQDVYALAVLAKLLGGDNSSRLIKQLVREQSIAASIGASYDMTQRLEGLFFISAIPHPSQTIETLKVHIAKTIKAIQTKGVTAKELQRVKTQIIATQVYAQDSLYSQAREIGELEVIGHPWQTKDSILENIGLVTNDDIKRVAKKYLNSDRLTISVMKPQLRAKPAL